MANAAMTASPQPKNMPEHFARANMTTEYAAQQAQECAAMFSQARDHLLEARNVADAMQSMAHALNNPTLITAAQLLLNSVSDVLYNRLTPVHTLLGHNDG